MTLDESQRVDRLSQMMYDAILRHGGSEELAVESAHRLRQSLIAEYRRLHGVEA